MFIKKSLLLILLCAGFVHGARAESCDAGYYDNDGTCTECPAGSYCTGNGVKVQCSGNKISVAGSDAETDCDACSGDTPYANSDHTECVACGGLNEYHNNGVCETCNPGYFANADHTECVPCSAGNYMKDGGCTTCPAGSYCTGDGVRVECPLGYTTAGERATSISDCKTMSVNLNGVVFPSALTAGKINTKVLTKKAD